MGRQTNEVLLGKQFDDTDCMELKAIRKGLEKEASKLAKSEAIIYSSSGVFMFFVTKQPSVSTFLNSVGVEAKIDRREISSIIADRKSINLVYIGAHVAYVSIQNQVISAISKLLADITITSDKTIEKLIKLKNAAAEESCPDSKRLQQMPEQNFNSLNQSVIDSSLKTKAKGGKRLSLKGSTLIMVDSEEFERMLGEEIPENVLDRLRRGDEMVVYRFVDTRLERTQASERRENRPIYSVYFPSDWHLFIYIPTENGSYWHQLDMQREFMQIGPFSIAADGSSDYDDKKLYSVYVKDFDNEKGKV